MTDKSRQDLEKLVGSDRDLSEPEERGPRLYVFVSFDLVDSTAYKNKEKEVWPFVFTQFYEVIKAEMKKKFPGIKVWKYIGDEILFFMLVEAAEYLVEIIPQTFRVIKSAREHLRSSFPKVPDLPYLKGALWCAPVMTVEGEELRDLNLGAERNIAFDVVYENQASLKDFIGPDIDIGFRMSKYVTKEKLVVSAEIAYLLLKSGEASEIMDKLNIVSYENMKGIWDGRYYPIIWYFDDWARIKESFEYDDRFKSKLIDQVYLNQSGAIKDELPKAFEQLKKTGELDKWLGILKKGKKTPPEPIADKIKL